MGGTLNAQPNFRFLVIWARWTLCKQEVGQAFVAFALEVVLGEPQGVIAEAVGGLGYLVGDGEGGGEVLVGEKAVVGGGARVAEIIDVDVACVEDTEFFGASCYKPLPPGDNTFCKREALTP